MKEIDVEVGFDWAAGNLGPALRDQKGPLLRDRDYQIFPLQLGFVEMNAAGGRPIWPTQLEHGDQLRFKIFDLDRRAPDAGEVRAGEMRVAPVLFHAYFQDVADPTRDRQLFADQVTPIVAGAAGAYPQRLVPAIGDRPSYVFGSPERAQGFARRFPAWQVQDVAGQELVLTVTKRPGRELDHALMALALRVRRGREERDYAVDPEIYVGPYGNDPPPIEAGSIEGGVVSRSRIAR